ncbi:hypothetical protein MZO42_11040 [Sphingomonas psychrotolerans]|uniref:DUF2335 domain-containing protein n=1 Tax=Sphingomonas psychrotolerans TaxID=1327635 RepID=A0ABU3N443_9SPHN|nr:hypothetical protein [Sphingomonas psychrotolerans]MDT8759232.1 hypothetical protein [Sphingomonas psychrotolerans]
MTSPPARPPEPTLDAIDAGAALVEAKTRPDLNDLRESEELEAVRLRNRLARSQIKNVKADRRMRKTYAGRILLYLELYSGAVGIMVLGSGFRVAGFALPVEILATLVGSTAVAAIGLVGFIARGLFRTPPPDPGQLP